MKQKTEVLRMAAGDFSFDCHWTRKPIKNLNLRVTPKGEVRVSSPVRTPRAQVERFVRDHAELIRRALERAARREAGQKPLALLAGEQIPICGVLHTVCHQTAKKARVWCENGALMFALPDPTDEAARAKAFARFEAEMAREVLTRMTAEFAPCFGLDAPVVTVRRMKGRWGSCFYMKNRICYSTNLLYVPVACAQLAVCHELAHFKHHDHSAAFYAWLARVLPDHKERKAALRTAPVPTFIWQ